MICITGVTGIEVIDGEADASCDAEVTGVAGMDEMTGVAIEAGVVDEMCALVDLLFMRGVESNNAFVILLLGRRIVSVGEATIGIPGVKENGIDGPTLNPNEVDGLETDAVEAASTIPEEFLDKEAEADAVETGAGTAEFDNAGAGVDVIMGVAKSSVANKFWRRGFAWRRCLGLDRWWSPLSLLGPNAPSDPTIVSKCN